MLKKLLSVFFHKRTSAYQLSGSHETLSPESVIGGSLTPSQKPNFVEEKLEFLPLLSEVKAILDDITARFPLPPIPQYPRNNDGYDYECAEAIQLHSEYVRDRVMAERAQAKAALSAAANQFGKGGEQIATALSEWATAMEAVALADEQSGLIASRIYFEINGRQDNRDIEAEL